MFKVELYNYWTKGARIPRNGWYVALYDGARRVKTVKDFGTNEEAAREYAREANKYIRELERK